jgi:hypothetical protein
MGSRQHNFYNMAFQRAGFRAEARKVQELWFAGRREEARAAVTDEMVHLSSLIGTESEVLDRLKALRAAGVTTVRLDPPRGPVTARVDTIGRALDLLRGVGG